jgi:hypothetical protein
MKHIKAILFLIGCFAAFNTGYAQRNIILSHGFGGDDASWNVYQPQLRAMLTSPQNVSRASYTSALGVGVGSTQVGNQVPNNNQNIAVAHSMGGIVWRNLDRLQPTQKAGGIITLGSPNRGGAILNSIQNGTIEAELRSGCTEAADVVGSTALAFGVSGLFGAVASTALAIGGPVFVAFKDNLCGGFFNRLRTGLPSATSQPLQDMMVGSTLINTLNNANTATKKVGVFGVEESPVHIRVLGSFFAQPSSKPLNVGVADATDIEAVNAFNTVNDVMAAGEAVFIVATVAYMINAIWNWSLLFPAMACAWAAYEWGDFRRWLAQSESRWHATIGAGGFFTETVNSRVFTCQSAMQDIYDLWESRRISAAQMRLMRANLQANPNCWATMPVEINFPINNESDGLFNAGTARIPTDPNDARHVVNERVEGANHQELLNHFRMTRKFSDIFAGRTNADRFFITP